MILIATENTEKALEWRQILSPHFKLYDIDMHDFRSLELCLKKVHFDLIVVDLALLGESGIHEISSIMEVQPKIHVVIMSKEPKQHEEILSILFGAKAYCNFNQSNEIFLKMIKCVSNNELWVDRQFVSRLLVELENITKVKHTEANLMSKGVLRLTPRETQIAQLISQGYTNRKIATQLNISERTVKAHLGVIFRKIGITDRLQLALYMNRHQQIATILQGSKNGHKLIPNNTHRPS